MLVAIPIHFLISIPKGRFRKCFIEGHWPEHDEPHPPALPKYIHFQHLVMMFVLGFTGLAIRFPFIDGGRTTLRYVHYVAMVIVIATYIWRLWYAFASKQRDWRAFAITKKDAMSTLGVVAYYAYLSNNKPARRSQKAPELPLCGSRERRLDPIKRDACRPSGRSRWTTRKTSACAAT